MRLKRAASFFDEVKAVDAYTGTLVGFVQVEPMDYYKLDGAAVRRRSISAAPSVSIPTRRAIRLGADVFLVGEPTSDFWKGKPIRLTYVSQMAPSLATVLSMAEALGDDPGRSAYASRSWNKYSTDSRDSADHHDEYHVFFGETGLVHPYHLVHVDDTWHLCKGQHPSLNGLDVAVCREIPGSVFEIVALSKRVYNPVSDSYTETPQPAAKVLRLRWQEFFEYLTASQTEYVRGDETAVMLTSDWTGAPADTLMLSDGKWKVLGYRPLGTTTVLHIRRD
jgi:hypothetical protein